jgi:hypothetical protein
MRVSLAVTGAKIETTTRKFREGVAFEDESIEVKYESTGHLSVRLLDASGTVPLADRKLKTEIPDEGSVELTSDGKGKVFHADVPFQDYELELEGGGKVVVPAVAEKKEVHDRAVPEVTFGFLRFQLRDADDNALADTAATVTDPDGKEHQLRSDRDGQIRLDRPVTPGTCRVKAGSLSGSAELPLSPTWLVVVAMTEASE